MLLFLQEISNSTKTPSYISNQPLEHLPEKYSDENMPQVTRELFMDCKYLTSKLNQAIGSQHRFKFQASYFQSIFKHKLFQ